jgi:hypothetical protein
METSLKKSIFIALSLITFVSCTLGIILSFYYGESLQKMLNSVLKIKVYEPFIGGKTIESFYDPLNDDTGTGTAVYPANSFYAPGNLDLVLYTVHEPVYHAPWQDIQEYWQLDLEFRTGFLDAQNPCYNKTVCIYIDTDGDKKGSVQTVFANAELVSFDSKHPWDIALLIAGNTGQVYNIDGEIIDTLEVVYSNTGKKIFVRVPLTKKELQPLYTAKNTYHYVLVGAYSQLDKGNLLPFTKRKTRTSGGGLSNNLMPKVYDMLYDGDQKQVLSSWDENSFSYAQISPISVVMTSKKNTTITVSTQKIQELQKEAETISLVLKKQNETRYEELLHQKNLSVMEKEELAELAFTVRDLEIAEQMYDQLLLSDNENPSYLAYKGSLESMKGSDASPISAIAAVNKGYTFLDKAIELTASVSEKNKEGRASKKEITHRLNALLNRGGCSQSVPNNVFMKASEGAQDYLEVAELAKSIGNDILCAQSYYDAALCFSLDEKLTESQIWKRESARLVKLIKIENDISDSKRLEMLSLKIQLMKEGLL